MERGHPLFATEELDERFVSAVERLASTFQVKKLLPLPEGGDIDANFAEMIGVELRNLSNKVAQH